MVTKKIQEAQDHFRKYNDFQECILEEILFTDFLTSVEIKINNIWTNKINVRNNLDSRKDIVHLKFKGLNSLRINNDLNDNILLNLDKINWGFNEIALAKIKKGQGKFMKVQFLWESDRAIEISCSELELIPTR